MACATSGCRRLPFAVLRGYRGAQLPEVNRTSAHHLPLHGRVLAAVPAIRADVAIIHAQKADAEGNVLIGASSACRRRPYSAPSLGGDGRGVVESSARSAQRVIPAALGRHRLAVVPAAPSSTPRLLKPTSLLPTPGTPSPATAIPSRRSRRTCCRAARGVREHPKGG